MSPTLRRFISSGDSSRASSVLIEVSQQRDDEGEDIVSFLNTRPLSSFSSTSGKSTSQSGAYTSSLTTPESNSSPQFFPSRRIQIINTMNLHWRNRHRSRRSCATTTSTRTDRKQSDFHSRSLPAALGKLLFFPSSRDGQLSGGKRDLP
jgi:hypothetical protein